MNMKLIESKYTSLIVHHSSLDLVRTSIARSSFSLLEESAGACEHTRIKIAAGLVHDGLKERAALPEGVK
jgi:hypothetical protein